MNLKNKLKEEFYKQYMKSFEGEGLTIKDCDYSWGVNEQYIETLDDVDRVIYEISFE